jgi:hypothetical protein
MEFAFHSREKGINGFEGCKRCGDGGFYLASYSKEGECSTCERITHPERFYPCPCCRLPQKYQMLCLKCSSGISEYWDAKTGGGPSNKNPGDWKIFTDYMDWEREAGLFTKAGDFISSYDHETITSIGDILPPAHTLEHVQKLGKIPQFTEHWPGYYMGNGKWQILDYLPILDENGIVKQ